MIKLLAILIAFLGLVIGSIITHFTKEELKPGKKYFLIAKKLILIVLIITLIYFSTFNLIFFMNLIIGLIAGLFLRRIYLYLSLAVVLAFNISNEILIFTASLIFIFGLFESALKNKNILVNFVLFVLPLSLLFLDINALFLSGFVIGSLINFLR